MKPDRARAVPVVSSESAWPELLGFFCAGVCGTGWLGFGRGPAVFIKELRLIHRAVTIVGCMPLAAIYAAVFILVCHTAGPVSYTHLDVYKRQECESSLNILLRRSTRSS